MKDKIFLITQDNALQELEAAAYATEDLLQRLLSDYPDLLAGYQMNEASPRRWLLIAREIGIADDPNAGERWSLDHLFLDQDGTPTLVEVKRASDTRIRREVVGQMLDYAANAILHWSPEVVRQKFQSSCEARDIDPAEAITEFLDVDPGDDDAVEDFWETVFNKLKIGQVRLVFVADRIPKELRRIIEFLNEHMPEVEVLGVELPQYVGEGLRTIVPRVVGQTSAAEQAKRPPGSRQWDEESFLEALQRRTDALQVNAVRRVLDWARERNLRVWWGTGAQDGSFIPMLDYGARRQQLFGVWTYGKFEFQFQYYRQPPFDEPGKQLELMSRLNEIDGVNLTERHIGKRPSVYVSLFTKEQNLKQLLASYDWFIDELLNAAADASKEL